MRRIITLLFSLLIFSIEIFGQSEENYIYSYEAMLPRKDTSDFNHTTLDSVALKTIQYFDGLGNPLQSVVKGFSCSNTDVIQPFEYNDIGIDTTNYLPYPDVQSSTGNYRPNFKTEHQSYFQTNYEDINGYAPVLYEKSPLQRINKKASPGAEWQISEHPVSYTYLTNSSLSNLHVKKWAVNDYECKYDGYYGDHELYVTKIIDEDGSVTYEFKDKQGNTTLKRSELTASQFIDTYYIYDDYNLLRFVISPEGSARFTQNFSIDDDLARQYVYFYKYDSRNRMVEKKLPGKEIEYYIYNKLDQVILYQDGNMRKVNTGVQAFDWKFMKYDALGRLILTGMTHQFPRETRDQVQQLASANEKNYEIFFYLAADYPAINNNYYTNQAFPILNSQDVIYTIDYFDTYDIYVKGDKHPIVSEDKMPFSTNDASFDLEDADLVNVTGQKTVSFAKYNDALWPTIFYYDFRGRLIQERSINHRHGYDVTSNEYFSEVNNSIANSEHKHVVNINNFEYQHKEKYSYFYDDEKRLIERHYQIDSIELHKVLFKYDPMGIQVIQKQVSEGADQLLTMDYKFNIKGWLTDINTSDNLFNMGLYYNKQLEDFNTPRYNGNISMIKWNTIIPSGNSNIELHGDKGYELRYDKLNRLSFANFYDETEGSFKLTTTYSESPVYDKNGNITSLIRNGKNLANNKVIIDNLTYTYNGNQVIAIDDGTLYPNANDFYDNGHYYSQSHTIEYVYDKNGNMVTDLNKGILEIKYNELNLPVEIIKDQNNRIEYYYDALGNKKRQIMYSFNGIKTVMTTTDFIGNFVYIDGVLEWNTFDEGRVVYPSTGVCFYENHVKDHLGNVRVTFSKNGTIANARDVYAYYPFGMGINSLTATYVTLREAKNEYLYNGKMFQDELGLNWYDYGARFYDPVVGRWWAEDPMSEVSRRWSPYSYCYNNPIRFIDPDGMLVDNIYLNEQGREIARQRNDQPDRTFIIKTTKATGDIYSDQEIAAGTAGNSNPIFWSDAKNTEAQLKSGNYEGDHMKNLQEIENVSTLKEMNSITLKDNGKGGTSDANNREYGGTVSKSNVVAESPAGHVINPKEATEASITHTVTSDTKTTFHSHGSGSVIEGPPIGTIGGITTKWSHQQGPSAYDIQNSGSQVKYEFARGDKVLYIYNNTGVIATMPTKVLNK
ncbi:MAG TPA: DUF6443 domain-containing protein [Lentimicrobium sp.]|nr:DUF6443 domain-containing protein [Lentimicrobium sp.]